uniref:Uncharacterized LOC107699387 n=1 Tax=Sinocyclocheilus anshuiensis TaxID=1608454 RepID=A0A671NXF7_9TELE
MNLRDFYKSLSFLLGKFSLELIPVNIATWGTADQSTSYYNWYAQNALDGKRYTCTNTELQSDPWWKLDLMKTYSVNRATITNRRDCCESRINGAEIRVGNVSSNVFSNPVCAVVSTIPAGASFSYSCHGMKGRYVFVNIPGTSKILTLCDVGVYVIFPDNLATGRTVTQSSTFGHWSADHAIDFNPGLTNSWSSCSSTIVQTNPWWRVDLRYIYRVSRVVITNILDCCAERINGAEIRIGNSLENNGNNNPICAVISSIPAGVSSTYICNNMEGRYVNLFIPGYSKYLTLCEVEVYGEGVIKQADLVFWENNGFTAVGIWLFTLQSALVEQGFSDEMLQRSQPPEQKVMRKEAVPREFVHQNTGKLKKNVDFEIQLLK